MNIYDTYFCMSAELELFYIYPLEEGGETWISLGKFESEEAAAKWFIEQVKKITPNQS